MKIRPKIILVFLGGYALGIPILISVLSNGMFQVADKQMKKQAETFGALLNDRILDISKMNLSKKEFQKEVTEEFREYKEAAHETQSFDVDKIILIGQDYKVVAGIPEETIGESYKEHNDVVETFENKTFEVVLEKEVNEEGEMETDIDVVSFLELSDGKPYVIEAKFDFEQTTSIIKKQYWITEVYTMLSILAILGLVQVGLHYLITRTVIRPVIKISDAMEQVGQGNFNVQVEHKIVKDEFGMMVKRFNEMMTGLKERNFLTEYVSRATMDKVREKTLEQSENKPERARVTLFFSDIRKFTTYSESRDPAHVIGVLNVILELQANIIHRYGGDIDKFVGDETMAIFDNPEQAIEASIAIQKEMTKNAEKIDNLQVGIGIYEGVIVRGDIGSSKSKDYTVIGDVVNTAARLQSIAGGNEILTSKSVVTQNGILEKYGFTAKGEMPLKGKSEKIDIYSIFV